MDYAKESLKRHGKWKGKIEVVSTISVSNRAERFLAYTPGVAALVSDEELSDTFIMPQACDPRVALRWPKRWRRPPGAAAWQEYQVQLRGGSGDEI